MYNNQIEFNTLNILPPHSQETPHVGVMNEEMYEQYRRFEEALRTDPHLDLMSHLRFTIKYGQLELFYPDVLKW